MSNKLVITRPALGQDVQLGMLYDARSMQLYGGFSLWDDDVVNEHQELEEGKIQDSAYSYSYSLQEARNKSSLDIEASLSLDLKLFSASGAAKYLNDTKSSVHEARVDVACTIVRRARRIPQKTLAHMIYKDHLDDPQYTHFVGEVVEGGSAALTFARSCSDEEEVKKVTGELQVSIVKIPISGSAKIDFTEEEEKLFETVKISYSGAIAESVVNLEDTLRVTRDMPTKLSKQLNTLTYTLFPLSFLDSKVERLIRRIDDSLVTEASATLRDGADATLMLKLLGEEEVFKKQFPSIRSQILNFSKAFSKAEVAFTKAARWLLPELRDGNTEENKVATDLQAAIDLFQCKTKIAKRYISTKRLESSELRTIVASLLDRDFKNHLGEYEPQSLIEEEGGPRLLLSFGGPSIGKPKHSLQSALEDQSLTSGHDDGDDAAAAAENDHHADEEEEKEESFQDQKIRSAISLSYKQLVQQRSLAIPDLHVVFGVASIDKAFRPGQETKSPTSVGDIILDDRGKLSIVTGRLAQAPKAPALQADEKGITVTWEHQESDDKSAIPTTGYVIKYRRKPNPGKDVAIPRATDNEPFTEEPCDATETRKVLSPVFGDCDYAVAICVLTSVGSSDWSPMSVVRTAKLSSVACEMLDFFNENKHRLCTVPETAQGDVPTHKPWELDNPGAGQKPTLFLGTVEVSRRLSADKRFEGEVASRIVDVAPEFRPDIAPSGLEDTSKTIVAIFGGVSGHGKRTEINAFISYLFGGGLEDAARIQVIDDRSGEQSGSVRPMTTCYRIRPFSPVFAGKTLLVVDIPGFVNIKAADRNIFIVHTLGVSSDMIKHINAIILTVRADAEPPAFISPVSTYASDLSVEEFKSCLHTIYTFSDGGAPPIRDYLCEIHWPVENGEIFVNNSAFTIELDGGEKDAMIRETWNRSVQAQFKVMDMLHHSPPVVPPERPEATPKRMPEKRCELAEKTMLQTAHQAQVLTAQLSALAEAVGKTPGQKVKIINNVSVQKPVQDGKSTTLCLDCNRTCHEVCDINGDVEKIDCAAMTNGFCGACKRKCKWDRHKNARYIIGMETKEEWVVPEELIKMWNKSDNTIEGALLGAMDSYLDVQKTLQEDIMRLAELSEELTQTALLHDPSGLINYLETLLKKEKLRGTSSEHLAQLTTAVNTLLLVRELRGKGKMLARDSNILLNIIGNVRKEMKRRMDLTDVERLAEENKACNLYNNLHDQLLAEVRDKAPPALKTEHEETRGALYPENLKAVIELMQLAITDSGVIAAIQREEGTV